MDQTFAIDHIRVAVKAVISRDNGKILLLRRSKFPESANPLRYSLPGGAMEPGETLLEALKREVSEETALDVDVKGLLAVNEWPAVRHRAYYVGLFFKCELVEPGARVVLNDENCEFRWANKMDAHKLDLVDSTRHVIRKYFSNGVDVLPYGEP